MFELNLLTKKDDEGSIDFVVPQLFHVSKSVKVHVVHERLHYL